MNLERPATNTGVLFYNNIELSHKCFYKRMVNVYQKSERAGIIRAGDDSSLALLMALHDDIKVLLIDKVWHIYRGLFKPMIGNTQHKNDVQKLFSDAYMIHLSPMKPWQYHRHYPNSLAQYYIEEWRKFWPKSENHLHQVQPSRKNNLVTLRKKNRIECVQKSSLPLSVYWYRGVQLNMGDEITPYLLGKILGRKTSDIQLCKKEPVKMSGLVLVSIGSVLRLCNKNTLIWGSGIRNIDQPVINAHRFCAVRGPLTRRRLIELGYNCPEVYGDPALLLPKYYQPEVAKQYTLGIIPHLVDYDNIAQIYADVKDILIIDVRTTDIEKIIKQILCCECTVSTSLHGIVLSVAYGIPTRWLKCSDKIMGDDTKFYDFFASLDPSLESALDYASVCISADNDHYEKFRPLLINEKKLTVKDLIAATQAYELNIELDALIKAFPGDYFRCLEKIV